MSQAWKGTGNTRNERKGCSVGRHKPCPLEGLNSDQSTHIKGLGKTLCSPVIPDVRWRQDPVLAGLVRLCLIKQDSWCPPGSGSTAHKEIGEWSGMFQKTVGLKLEAVFRRVGTACLCCYIKVVMKTLSRCMGGFSGTELNRPPD